MTADIDNEYDNDYSHQIRYTGDIDWDSNTPDQLDSIRVSGTFETDWNLDGVASYDALGNLEWDAAQTTYDLNGVAQSLDDDQHLTDVANGSTIMVAWWDLVGSPGYAFGDQMEIETGGIELATTEPWTNDPGDGATLHPLGYTGSISILKAPFGALDDALNNVQSTEQIPAPADAGGSNDSNTLNDEIAYHDASLPGQGDPNSNDPTTTPTAPLGAIIPTATKNFGTPTEPAGETPPTDPLDFPETINVNNDFDGHGEECGEDTTPVKIEIYELWDLNEIALTNDNELYGYAILYYYEGSTEPVIQWYDKGRKPIDSEPEDIDGNPNNNTSKLVKTLSPKEITQFDLDSPRINLTPRIKIQILENKAKLEERSFAVKEFERAQAIYYGKQNLVSTQKWRSSNSSSYLINALLLTFVGDNSKHVAGDYKPNALGVGGSVVFGLTGFDFYKDLADIEYSVANWEWKWSHAGGLTLNLVALLPLIGAAKNLKYADELAEGVETAADTARNVNKCVIKSADHLTHQDEIYETLSEQIIRGTSRSTHRKSANEALLKQLESDPKLNAQLSEYLGVDDLAAQMRSGKGKDLLNPKGTEWHHPIHDPSVMQLLRRDVHRHRDLQEILHPGPNGTGGYGTNF